MPAPSPKVPALGRVLVTGGCGLLGSHIVSILLSKTSAPDTTIYVVDLREPTSPQAGVTYHTANIISASSVSRILEHVRPDVVIHTASTVFKGKEGPAERQAMWDINVEGTRNLLDASKRVGVRAFVYTSSASVVSDTRTDLVNADERWHLIKGEAQAEYYTTTKADAELLALSYNSRSDRFLTTAIRPSALFGEKDVQMMPNMLKVAREGRTRFQLGANENLFDFTYIGNTAYAHVLAAARLVEMHATLASGEKASVARADKSEKAAVDGEGDDEPPNVDGEAFLITNHSPVYFWDFARAVWNEYYRVSPESMPKAPATMQQIITLPKEVAIVVSTLAELVMGLFGKAPTLTPARVRYSCMTRYFKTRKAEDALGYTPQFTLDEGIERTVKWFVEKEREDALAASKQ